MVDFGQNGNFVVGKLTELRSMLELFHIHNLHCEVLVILLVLGLVDVSILSLTDFFKQHVIFNYFVH